jgi:hypothetical protein
LNYRAVSYQFFVFLVQWGLMILGFAILSKIIAPAHPFENMIGYGNYLDAILKALVALVFSLTWLYIWDRQVRLYFYRRGK